MASTAGKSHARGPTVRERSLNRNEAVAYAARHEQMHPGAVVNVAWEPPLVQHLDAEAIARVRAGALRLRLWAFDVHVGLR